QHPARTGPPQGRGGDQPVPQVDVQDGHHGGDQGDEDQYRFLFSLRPDALAHPPPREPSAPWPDDHRPTRKRPRAASRTVGPRLRAADDGAQRRRAAPRQTHNRRTVTITAHRHAMSPVPADPEPFSATGIPASPGEKSPGGETGAGSDVIGSPGGGKKSAGKRRGREADTWPRGAVNRPTGTRSAPHARRTADRHAPRRP